MVLVLQEFNVFVIITVARQIDGDFVLVKAESLHQDRKVADAKFAQLKKDHSKEDGGNKPVKITTPHGNIDCYCEATIFEIDVT